MRKLVYSALLVPNGPLLESRFRYDFVSYTALDGKYYMLDGGLEYQRYSNPDGQLISVYSDDPFEQVREVVTRWNGRLGRWIKLKDIADDWLENILMDYIVKPKKYINMSDEFKLLYLQEQLYRAEQEYDM